MKTRKVLLSIDLFFQTILFFGAFAGGILTAITGGTGFFILLIPLFFLGIWQVSSGLLMGLLLKDMIRIKYFLGSIIYIVFLMALEGNFMGSHGTSYMITLGIFGGIIPLGIAYWYLRLTNHTIHKLDKLIAEEERYKEGDLENILDGGEVLK